MEDKKPQYLEYKGLPLVREGDCFCYGDPSEKYILILNVLTKKENGEPDAILVQISQTNDKNKIAKQAFKNGLFEALDLGTIWLEQMIKEG